MIEGQTVDPGPPSPRVAHFLAHYPSNEGTSSFCRGLSGALNRLCPGSCKIISFRPGEAAEEVLSYPRSAGAGPFMLPEELRHDLLQNKHGLNGLVLHGTYNPLTVAMKRLADRAGIPYIFIPHDPYPPALRRHHPVRKWVFWHLFEKRMIEGARALQLLDSSHEAYLRQLGCKVPVEVIPNGCSPQNLGLLPADAKVPGSGSPLRLLFLGRIDRNHKGLDLLIEGFARWQGACLAGEPAVELVITGKDWGDRAALEQRVRRLGMEGKIVFTGERPEPAMHILSEADLVVLCSRFDGFGLCIVEAMLAGRPVLVSSQAGVSSHVRAAGAGWLVEPEVASISRGLAAAVAARAEWEETGRKGRAYVLGNLTWEQAAAKSMAVYRRYFMGADGGGDRNAVVNR